MVKNRKTEYYSAQTLALIMAFLVVAAIIGFAMISKIQKNNSYVVTTQENYETSGLLGDVISQFQSLNNNLLYENVARNEEIELSSSADFRTFFESLENEFDLSYADYQCDSSRSSVKATLELSNNTFFEIKRGKVLGYDFTANVGDFSAPCSLDFKFELRGSTESRFVIHRIYGDGSYDDLKYYCLASDGVCDNLGLLKEWNDISLQDTVSVDLSPLSNGAKIKEVRILALNSDIAVNSDLSTRSCAGSFDERYVYVIVTNVCNDVSGTKEAYIPYRKYLTYSSISDYTMYSNIQDSF